MGERTRVGEGRLYSEYETEGSKIKLRTRFVDTAEVLGFDSAILAIHKNLMTF